MTTLITAIFGGYDQPKALPGDHGFDAAILVTDSPVFVEGWQVVVLPSDETPRLTAKRPKAEPWRWTDDDRTLWVDGSFEVLPGGGLRRAVDEHLADGDLVAWRHPYRVDVYEEAVYSAAYVKYASAADDLKRQADDYQAAGLPPASGLYECGMIARRHTQAVQLHGAAWLQQMRKYTLQDQVSFPFVCWARGVEVTPWRAHTHWDCGWVRWHPHRDET